VDGAAVEGGVATDRVDAGTASDGADVVVGTAVELSLRPLSCRVITTTRVTTATAEAAAPTQTPERDPFHASRDTARPDGWTRTPPDGT